MTKEEKDRATAILARSVNNFNSRIFDSKKDAELYRKYKKYLKRISLLTPNDLEYYFVQK